MKAASTSETSVYLYQTTQRNILEDSQSSYSVPRDPEISYFAFHLMRAIVSIWCRYVAYNMAYNDFIRVCLSSDAFRNFLSSSLQKEQRKTLIIRITFQEENLRKSHLFSKDFISNSQSSCLPKIFSRKRITTKTTSKYGRPEEINVCMCVYIYIYIYAARSYIGNINVVHNFIM
jgi:hypothetical protein